MRLLRIATVYDDYAAAFYAARPQLAEAPYAQQREAMARDAFGWGDAWVAALGPLGIDVEEVTLNAAPAQRAWAREWAPALADGAPEAIALAQARAFAPEVIWYDHHDVDLLQRLRALPSVRAVLGWTGSYVPKGEVWRHIDLVLTCAPESVDVLRARGLHAGLLHHAFDPRVLERIEQRPPTIDVSFVGQLAADHPLHVHRERLLATLLEHVDVAVFAEARPRARGLPLAARRVVHDGLHALRRLGAPETALRRLPVVGRAAGWAVRPRGPLPPRLAAALQPPRYGLAMFQTLADSRLTLNVHACGHTRHSSNMRLFEATGVGACLVTDWAEGLGALFEPGVEVATYRDDDECVEVIRELLAHEDARAAMAQAAQRRVLREHTFAHRAPVLEAHIRGALG